MSWQGRFRISNWRGSSKKFSQWQGLKGDALIDPAAPIVMYGNLYNWHAVNKASSTGDSGYEIAPTGWRVATESDYNNLISHIDGLSLGVDTDLAMYTCRYQGSTVSGCNTSQHPRWAEAGGGLDRYPVDTFGLSLLPSGERVGGHFDFNNLGARATLWTSSDHSSTNAKALDGIPYQGIASLQVSNYSKSRGFPARCVRGATAGELSKDDGESCGFVEDVDGHEYPTVKIGNLVWMRKNLGVKSYRNGEPITHITGSTDWLADENGARCAYNNDENLAYTNEEWMS